MIEGGGADPRWGFGEGEELPFELKRQAHQVRISTTSRNHHAKPSTHEPFSHILDTKLMSKTFRFPFP